MNYSEIILNNIKRKFPNYKFKSFLGVLYINDIKTVIKIPTIYYENIESQKEFEFILNSIINSVSEYTYIAIECIFKNRKYEDVQKEIERFKNE